MRMSKIIIWLSLIAAFLMAFVSLFGIISDNIYAKETANWAAQAVGQDYVNLFFAFPALVISSLLLRKKSLKALLVWLGILLYMIYSYLLYSFFVHFGPLFLFYIAILGLSFYAFVGGLLALEWHDIGKYIGNAGVRPASILLAVIGAMFYFLWLTDVITALVSGGLPKDLDKTGLMVNPVHVLDMALLLPGALIVSALLWRRRTLGLVLAVPFLSFFILMGIAIISMMIVMALGGFPLSIPPLAMMVTIIALSLVIMLRFLKRVGINN